MPMTTLENDIRRFIVENFLFGKDDGTLKSNSSFLESGVIDSTGVLELVMFLETNYGLKVEDDELTPDNMDSIDRLAAFIQRKRPAAGGAHAT